MEDLLEYSQYKQLLCIYIDGDSSIHLTIGSNRAMEVERPKDFYTGYYSMADMTQRFNRAINVDSIKSISGYSIVNESKNVFVKDLFPAYFDLQSKTRLLTAAEMLLQSIIVDYFQDMKQTVLNEPDLLETSQLIFILPIEWEGEAQQDHVRNLFLEAGWIRQQDGRNKLIFAPFIEVMVDYLQKSRKFRKQFFREGKYMFCYVRLGHNDNEILFNSMCFQMQSAKEMSAISKTLASSNFMLVPTIKSIRTIKLSNTDQIVRNVVERLLSENSKPPATRDMIPQVAKKSRLSFLKKPFKMHHHHSEQDILQDIIEATMSELSSLYKIYNQYGSDEPWSRDNVKSHLNKREFTKYTSGLTCGRLITEIWEHADVQQFLERVGDSIRVMIKQYNTLEGSPDGIQDVILYKCNPRIKNASCAIVEDVLTNRVLKDVDILEWENAFIETPRVADICTSAILRPVKMIQIANAVLPPIIVDQQDTNSGLLQCSIQTSNNEIIAPNTYYAQVLISKQHIDFILNKVVKMPSSDNTIQKFTVLEKRIEMPSIMESTLENMWNHYQSLDLDVLQANLLRRCSQRHNDVELSLKDYNAFKSSLLKMIMIWFTNMSPVAEEEPDSYQLVSINETCDCSLRISHRMLLEVGLRPTITKLASMIVGTLISNDSFGSYHVPNIIIHGSIIENLFFSYHSEQCLKESVQNCFYVHQRKPTIHFYDEANHHQLTHCLGRGSFSQLSSTAYIVEFHAVSFSDGNIIIGVQQQEDAFSKKLEVERYKTEFSHTMYTSQLVARYLLLERGDVLPPEGTSKLFMIRHCNNIRVDILAIETTLLNRSTRRRMWSEELSWGNPPSHPITISISPVHNTSTVRITVSCLKHVYVDKQYRRGLGDYKKSVNIHERLHLKAASQD